MKILIVGGTSSLAHALKPVLSEFAEVITAGRTGCDVHLDLSDPVERIELPRDIDVVINAAASFGGKSFEEMLQTESVNVLGVLKLCQSCTKAQIKHLVLISSIFACLDNSSRFYSIYSLSKKHAEEIAQLHSSMFGLPLTILRPSQFYGVGEVYRKHQPFLSTIIEKAAKGEDILIYGSNDALRNFIHVEDVAKILALVIQRKIEGTYSCMNIENVSYSEVASAAIEAFGSKSAIKFVKEQPDIPNNIFDPDDLLFRLIDYYPQISILLGMKKEAAFRKVAR
jgi:nucleoside-diphosphate-sugar epimerase